MRAILVALVLLASAAHADPVLLRLGTPAPEGTVWAREIRNFTRVVEQRTDGRVRIKAYFGSIAGSEAEALDRVRRGQLDGVMSGGPACQQVSPTFLVLQIPGLFQEAGEVRYVFNQLQGTLVGEAQQAGFLLVGFAPLGSGMYFGRKPVTTMAQLRAVKLWVWDLEPHLIALMREMGLNVVPAPVEKAGRELEAGHIDGFWSLPTAALAFQWSTQAPNLVDLRGEYLIGCVAISLKSLAPISADDQRSIMTSGAELAVRFDDTSRQQEDALLHGAFQHQGVQIKAASASFRSEFFAAARAAREKLAGQWLPAEQLQRIMSLLSDYRVEHAR
jgi:TRAP-type C4-dicarboxylate transport system substrate-binding protein